MNQNEIDELGQRIAMQASRSPSAPEPSASVGVKPVAEVMPQGTYILCDSVAIGDKLYSAEQLATLQAKLEQAEKDKAELVAVLNSITLYGEMSSADTDKHASACEVTKKEIKRARKMLAKYEVKK